MTIKLSNLTGSGKVKDDSIISYNYSEDVTSLEPGSLTGGTGQVSISAEVEDVNTSLLVNNEMLLTDPEYGQVNFLVKAINISNGVVSITGDTVQSRLNVEVTAGPVGGSTATLFSAIYYYCGLVDVVPDMSTEFQEELDLIPVNFIGWKGNLWEHLKMLCAAVSASETENVGIEMFVEGNVLHFRKAKQVEMKFETNALISRSLSVETFDAAKEITISNYNTRYGVDEVVKEANNRAEIEFPAAQNVSITDSMQVEAGATLTKRFTINASLESLQETPVCVSQISSLPYTGTTGEYVIVGTDNLPIQPAQWIGEGGSLVVALTENPNEIEITITAPPNLNLPQAADPAKFGYAPYKIGVESSGDVDYPALYIVGTGVFYDKQETTLGTGASNDYTSRDSAPQIDNLFITNKRDMYNRGIAAAQAACGPKVTLTESIDYGVSFGDTPGVLRSYESNKYRVSSVSYSPTSATMTSISSSNFADFDVKWTGKDFSDFTATALDPDLYPDTALKFNEFTIIPLMESA
jgi:hypothetical protein